MSRRNVGRNHGAAVRTGVRATLRRRAALLAGVAFAALPGIANAQTAWEGAISNDWFTAGNWNPAAVPGAGQDVEIDAIVPNPTVVNGAGTAGLGFLVVGWDNEGKLGILNGGAVSNTLGRIGLSLNSIGTVTVTGPGSTWANSGNLFVGTSGAGTLTIAGGGTVTNTDGRIGANPGSIGAASVTGPGSTWTNSSGLFVGFFGTGTLTVTDGGTVTSTGGSIGNFISGVGTVTVTGAGSNWTSGGNLSVGDAGTGTLTITAGGAVTNTQGLIGNAGPAVGTVLVTGAGSTWTNDLLVVGNAGTGTLTVTDGGTVVSKANGVIGNVAGSTGTVLVTGAGSTWTNNNILGVGAGGTGALTVADGGTVTNSMFSVIGQNGAGAVTVTGAGSAWTNGGGVYVGVNGIGTLTVTDGGMVANTQSIIGDFGVGTVTVTGPGSTWTNSGTFFFVGNAGTGTLTVADGGAVAVTSGIDLAFNGASTGALNIGAAAGAAPAGPGVLNTPEIRFGDGNGTLVFNHTGMNHPFAAALTSAGAGTHAIEHLAGVTVLTGNGAGFTGATTVSGGTLRVNNTLGGTMLVNGTGTLGGTGTVGPTTIAGGGTLAPGNSIGTINVQGNLVMTAGSSYRVEVDGAASDLTAVTGTATLAGTVQVVPIGSLQRNYTILSAAGGLTGNFSNAATLPGLLASLSYTGTEAQLSLTAVLGQNQNLPQTQQTIANTLNTFFNAGNALPAGFVAPFALSGPALINALAQLSGENAAGIQQAGNLSMGLFLNAMLDPFVTGRNGAFGAAMAYAPPPPLPSPASGGGMGGGTAAQDAMAKVVTKAPAAPPTFEQRWSVWGAAYGGRNRTDGEATIGSSDLSATAAGFAAGADYRVSPNAVLGAAVAIGETRWDVGSLGSGDSNVAQVGGYASTRWNGFYLSGAVAFAWHNADTGRTVAVAGLDRLNADFNTTSFGARVEGGHRFALGHAAGFGVTPYAAVQVQSLRTPGYSEVAVFGSNQFALSYASQTATDTRTELGAWLDSRHALAGGTQLVLRGRAAWVHDFDPESRFNAAFQTLPGAAFTVDGAAAPDNSALLSAVGELRLANGLSFIAKADGEFSDRATTYAGTGTVRYQW